MHSKASEVQTQIGKKAPAWELVGLDGKNVSSDTYKGKIMILNFWATWCPPCRAEIPDFMKLHETYKDKNVVVLGVSLDSGLGPVKRFVRTQKLNYPVLMGNGKLVAELGNFSAIPQTFIIDEEGRIHTQFRGLVKFEELEKKLNTLIGVETEK
jgi:peroxiredoxin